MHRSILRVSGRLLFLSLMTTLVLLIAQGSWQEALPLHLCSVSALCAWALAHSGRQSQLDFLWYLGMPGAALALLFPAPAVCRFQMLLNASYFATHALIVLIPIFCLAGGARPTAGKTAQMMKTLLLLAAIAGTVNHLLETDYLFLSAPPDGTPLEHVFVLGYPAYLLTLAAMMLVLCMIMDALARVWQCVGVQ